MGESTFVLAKNYKDIFLEMSDKQAGRLIKAIYEYVAAGDSSAWLDDVELRMAFKFIRQDIDFNNERWKKTLEARSQAGKKGNEKRWGKVSQNSKSTHDLSQNVANVANVAEDVNVVVVEDVIKKEINKEKKTDSFSNPKGQANQDLQKAFGEYSAFVETDSPLAKEIERHIAFCKQCNFVLRGGYRGYLQKLFNVSGGIGNIAYEIVCVLLEAKSCNIRPLTDGEYRAFAAKQKKRGQEQKDIEKSNAFEEKDVKAPDGIADLIKPKEIVDTRTFDEKKQEALRKAKLLTG